MPTLDGFSYHYFLSNGLQITFKPMQTRQFPEINAVLLVELSSGDPCYQCGYLDWTTQ